MTDTQNQRPVVLVTGCSMGGIGASLASKFAEAGCTVYATARNVDSMQSLKSPPTSGIIHKLALDIDEDSSVQAVVQEIIEASGRIDILVNNA